MAVSIYTDNIVVRLSRAISDQLWDAEIRSLTSESMRNTPVLGSLADSFASLDLVVSRPSLVNLDYSSVINLEEVSKESKRRSPYSATQYWLIDVSDRQTEVDAIVEKLLKIEGVEHAFKERRIVEPGVYSSDPYNVYQRYMDASDIGLDVRWCWSQDFCEGAGVNFADVERGWVDGHEDYIDKNPELIFGNNLNVATSHGSAVLGIVAACDNAKGVIGIVPSVSSVKLSSHYIEGVGDGNIESAIIAAANSLSAGDVLLIEAQLVKEWIPEIGPHLPDNVPDDFFGGLPVELDERVFNAIAAAVDKGIIVIEPAANGLSDLDDFEELNRCSASFRDSGAILVGASKSDLSNAHNESHPFTNKGSRIDCFAWGKGIWTCGGAVNTYKNSFGLTSGASAIIAGAAILLQGRYKATHCQPLSPQEMRALLSNPDTATPQADPMNGNNGVMPDLKLILENTLDQLPNVLPDLLIRNDLADTGIEPSVSEIGSTPDIIVVPDAVLDPNAIYGAGSGEENNLGLSEGVVLGQDNYIYVRFRNIGGMPAHNSRASIFVANEDLYGSSTMWKFIGISDCINVDNESGLVVTESIIWKEEDIPEGSYVLVALTDHASDHAPKLPILDSWAELEIFARSNNGVSVLKIEAESEISTSLNRSDHQAAKA